MVQRWIHKDFSNFKTGTSGQQDSSSLRRGARGEVTAAIAERTRTEAGLRRVEEY